MASDSLQELDVIHVGGTPESPNGAYIVSGVGTSASAQLTSWRVRQNAPTPDHLADSATFPGRDLDLHLLPPTNDNGANQQPFIASRIRDDGNLWLTAYELNAAGSFITHGTRGFGANASITVLDHAIAHTPADARSTYTQVVTPVVAQDRLGNLQMRVVTWRVHNETHTVEGVGDSGPLDVAGIPSDGGGLAIHYSSPGVFDLTYTNTNGALVTRYIGVADNGSAADLGGSTSGLSYQGSLTTQYADHVATARLNGQAFVAITEDNGQTEMSVWERRVDECIWFVCTYDPYKLGSSLTDERPGAPGVAVPLPNLTHAYGTSPSTDAHFGESVAAGDFNGDGYQDIAVGAPDQTVGTADDAGAVTILYGSANGIFNSEFNLTLSQATAGMQGVADAGDKFGQSLAAGDFNGDGRDDLAIGVPGEGVESDNLDQVGVVQILFGGPNGLSIAGNVLLRQGEAGVAGISEAGDQFGWSLAAGDFNHDGRADLAVGIPFEDHNQQNIADGGAIHVFYGSNSGLRTDNDISWHQDLTGILDEPEANDHFGWSLAAGDFDNDGRDDLAVGVPGERAFGFQNAGAVHVFMGAGSGLSTQDKFISQDGIFSGANGTLEADISDGTESDDRFGESLAIGDFDGDGYADLAIGVSQEDLAGPNGNSAGRVHVVRGSVAGITATGEQVFDLSSSGIVGDPEIGGRFGYALAAGDTDNDGHAELLIGTPYQDSKTSGNVTYANSGVAYLLRGTASGLTGLGSQLLRQGLNSMVDEHFPGEYFGFAVALADLDHDGYDDAIIGVPNEDMSKLSSDYQRAGAVHVIYSDSANGDLSTSNVLWGQGTAKHIRAKLAHSGWEAQYGVGNGELYEEMPAGPVNPEHAASVTKTMTLLLAAEALQLPNSPISLDDVVTISEKAGTTGGSKMDGTQDGETVNIEPGDRLTLETLLYGMMIWSCNRASVAIAEHIAVNVYGANAADLDDPFDVFVEHMNGRAEGIGLDDTRYGHPAGGSVTTPQDLITFFREAWQNSLFRRFSSATAEHPDNPATTLNLDPPKVFQLRRTNTYVGMDGYKGGHGKVGDVYDAQGNLISAPNCDQCHVGQATRAGHSLITGIQQSKDDLANAKELYDYGFGLLFTPDRRGHFLTSQEGPIVILPGQPVMGDLQSIALDHITGNWVISAGIDDDNHLQLRSWSVSAGTGSIAPLGGTIATYDNLAPSVGPTSAARNLAIAQLTSSGKVLADYVTGRIVTGDLRLDVWRLGAEYAPPVEIEDLNFDGSIDASDAGTLFGNWGRSGTGDLNDDGIVDAADAGRLFAQWTGDSLPSRPQFDPIAHDQVFAEYSPGQRKRGWKRDGTLS